MKITFPLTLSFAVMFTTGCSNALKCDYHAPHINYPTGRQHTAGNAAPAPFDWQDFHDPGLEHWLQQVMANNNDLAVAVLRVYRSQLEVERSGIITVPDVSISLTSAITRPLSISTTWNKASSASLSTSYEVDLWGKLARQRDATEWSGMASSQDLQAARLALLADAAINYWRIGFINQQITISQTSIIYARETLRLANARYRAGSISSLDVVNAKQSLLSQESRLLALQQARQQALNEHAVLLGTPSDQAAIAPARLPTTIPQINTGIPVSILSRRPDLRAKEMRLHAALARVDEQRLQYYPAFNLTGSLGASSSALLEFLRNPMGSIGTSLTLPFLKWRQMNVDIRIARNDYEQQALAFRQALYKAMGDVNNALSLRTLLLAQEAQLRTSLLLARQSEQLNEIRYRQGVVTITDWLDAQEQRRQAELAVDENRFAQYQNLAKIYLEFGGA